MIRVKRAIYVASLALALILASLAATPPAYASVTQNRCARNVCMQIVRNTATGKTIYSAYVYMPGVPQGTVATIHYNGSRSNGTATGPQHSITVTCGISACGHKWTINFTYVAGNYIYGWATISGVVEGVPTYSF